MALAGAGKLEGGVRGAAAGLMQRAGGFSLAMLHRGRGSRVLSARPDLCRDGRGRWRRWTKRTMVAMWKGARTIATAATREREKEIFGDKV